MAACLAAVLARPAWAAVDPAPPDIPDRRLDAALFGAKGGGTADETAALQAAIDAASRAGGGTVAIGPGVHMSGPLQLADRIGLELEAGATLRMLPLGSYPGGTAHPRDFIGGRGLHDIAITGAGTIDGQGTPWWPFARVKGARRPRMIALGSCRRVLLKGITLMNSPMFHIAISGRSSDVAVIGVTIRASPSTDPVHPGHNTDACDVAGRNILIRDCDVSVGDDDFTCGGGTSEVLISHCTYGYGHGVSIGSYASGVSDITVENCTFTNTECGIRLKSDRDRGGLVRHLVYRNLTMTDVRLPILIYGAYLAKDRKYRDLNALTARVAATYPAAPLGPRTPRFEDISFINIRAVAAKGCRAGLIWGLPEAPVRHVLLQNVDITADRPFGVFDAQDVRLVNTVIRTPEGVNRLDCAGARVSRGD